MAVVGGFFERLGDAYFRWWYVQLMLSYDTGMSLYAFIYSILYILYIVYLIWDLFVQSFL